ncbi:MAG: phage holin family protein [Thermomicrobiales bacterium]|nr:phage holin family protein [Thermomicrobiales bacterium]
MVRILAYALAAIVAALATATISSEWFSFDSRESVMIFGAVMGVINAFIRPVVRLVSLPLTCLTFGLFAFVINALLFAMGAYVVPGIELTAAGAVLGSLIASIAAGLMFSVFDE